MNQDLPASRESHERNGQQKDSTPPSPLPPRPLHGGAQLPRTHHGSKQKRAGPHDRVAAVHIGDPLPPEVAAEYYGADLPSHSREYRPANKSDVRRSDDRALDVSRMCPHHAHDLLQ